MAAGQEGPAEGTGAVEAACGADGRSVRRRRWIVAGALATAALATVVRLATWEGVFGGSVIRLAGDGDVYYHVRRIRMMLEQGAIVWRDPWLNYPVGADIPWPPLFDVVVAAACWIAGLGDPSPRTILAVAAVAPVVLGVGAVALGAALAAEVLGPAAGVGVAVLLSVSQPHVFFSLLGRADQHVMELLLFCAAALAFVRGLRDERVGARRALLVGALLALSFWNWLGSALTLLVLGVSCVVAGIVQDPGRPEWGRAARLLAWGSAAAAAMLAASIGVAGPAGALRRMTLGGLSAFPVVLCAVEAVLAASLLLVRVRSRIARAALLAAVPAAILGLALLAVPALREPVVRGLTAAGTGNVWYGSIGEFMPNLFSGIVPLGEELRTIAWKFGLWPVVAAAGVFEAWRRMREEPARTGAILVAMVVAVVFTVATALMKRFELYGSVPLAIFSWAGLALVRRTADRLRPRTGAVAASIVGAAALALPAITLAVTREYRSAPVSIDEALERLRGPTAGSFRIAVLAPWDLGHHVLLCAERPVVASPFGTEGGAGAMEDLRAFQLETDPDAAERLLLRRGVRYVVLRRPVTDAVLLAGHGVRVGGAVQAARTSIFDRIPDLIVSRLYRSGGAATDSPPHDALESFRLVDEVQDRPSPVLVFELVPAATIRIRGGSPGRLAVARVVLTSPDGRQGEWRTRRTLDRRGDAVLRVPYATGWNGRLGASLVVVSDGVRSGLVTLTEEQVTGGADLVLDLRS